MTVVFSLKFGFFTGVSFGLNYPSGGGPVTADATSGKLVPTSASEWVNFMGNIGSPLGPPTHLYSLQEASGNALDLIGSSNLTASGITYSKAVAGWNRTAMSGTGSVASSLNNSTFLDTSANSFFALMYLRYDAATIGVRGLFTLGNPLLQIPDTKIRLREGGSLASTVNDHSGTVHPIIIAFNNTATTIKLYSDLEKLSITYSASVGSGLTLNPSSAADPGVSDLLYLATWTGAASETNDTEFKKIITGLGYSPPWS